MPYIKVTPEQIRNKEFPAEIVGRVSDFKLCYVDDIPRTVFDYRPEIMEKYKDIISLPYEEYQQHRAQHPDLKMEDFPNPEYVAGVFEINAYFTPIPLYEQWGDDWDDVPYECNAEIPYDDIIVETKVTKEGLRVATKIDYYNIVVVPCCVKSKSYLQPKDYGYNSPFSVEMINAGAAAWIYDPADGRMENMTSIQAGCGLDEFLSKLDRIEKNNPDYKPYDEND